ncbi:hypothetical protein [Blautia faecis]|uniref:hypothetical protein n=1 Tax=Blautia faecis TaxID=871665 RepID=UPI002079EF21|nr:hypothetical protein [Blautia faecis]
MQPTIRNRANSKVGSKQTTPFIAHDKKVFLICTYGGSANYKSIEQILNKKHASVEGKFGCKGYDTFGPFKLVGGIAKGHPDDKDIQYAVEFVKDL